MYTKNKNSFNTLVRLSVDHSQQFPAGHESLLRTCHTCIRFDGNRRLHEISETLDVLNRGRLVDTNFNCFIVVGWTSVGDLNFLSSASNSVLFPRFSSRSA